MLAGKTEIADDGTGLIVGGQRDGRCKAASSPNELARKAHKVAMRVLDQGGSLYDAIDEIVATVTGVRARCRSTPQHRRFFKLISVVYHHWPETHPFQPDNSEHLRKWLLIKAKHRVIHEHHAGSAAREMAALIPVLAKQLGGIYCWSWHDGPMVYVCTAKSIAYDNAGHAEFTEIINRVEDVIEKETNINPNELMAEAENEP